MLFLAGLRQIVPFSVTDPARLLVFLAGESAKINFFRLTSWNFSLNLLTIAYNV
jgi:hypothetical protein